MRVSCFSSFFVFSPIRPAMCPSSSFPPCHSFFLHQTYVREVYAASAGRRCEIMVDRPPSVRYHKAIIGIWPLVLLGNFQRSVPTKALLLSTRIERVETVGMTHGNVYVSINAEEMKEGQYRCTIATIHHRSHLFLLALVPSSATMSGDMF